MRAISYLGYVPRLSARRAAVAGPGADAGDRGAATPGGRGQHRTAGRSIGATRCDRGRQRLGVGERTVWLAALSQPPRGGRLPRAYALALRKRGERNRARHFESRQQALARAAGGARLVLAALSARERTEPVVYSTLRRRGQAHAPYWNCGARPASGDCAVALPRARGDSGRGEAQTDQRLEAMHFAKQDAS